MEKCPTEHPYEIILEMPGSSIFSWNTAQKDILVECGTEMFYMKSAGLCNSNGKS